MHVNVGAYCCKKNTETDSEHFDMDCNQAPSQPTREHGLLSSTYEPGNVWKCAIEDQWLRMFRLRRVWRIRGTSYTHHTRTERKSCLQPVPIMSKHRLFECVWHAPSKCRRCHAKWEGFYLHNASWRCRMLKILFIPPRQLFFCFFRPWWFCQFCNVLIKGFLTSWLCL